MRNACTCSVLAAMYAIIWRHWIPPPISVLTAYHATVRFSQRRCWRFSSSGTVHCVGGSVLPAVQSDRSAVIFSPRLWQFDPEYARWSSETHKTTCKRHTVTSQKIWAVRDLWGRYESRDVYTVSVNSQTVRFMLTFCATEKGLRVPLIFAFSFMLAWRAANQTLGVRTPSLKSS